MRPIRYAVIAAAISLAAPGPALAADCDAIEDRRARTDCLVEEAHQAKDSYRVNTCARQMIAAAMTMTIAKAELHNPQALSKALSDPEGALVRVQRAVAESSEALADLLWFLFVSDEREGRKDVLNICVRELGKSPFDSEPTETVAEGGSQ